MGEGDGHERLRTSWCSITQAIINEIQSMTVCKRVELLTYCVAWAARTPTRVDTRVVREVIGEPEVHRSRDDCSEGVVLHKLRSTIETTMKRPSHNDYVFRESDIKTGGVTGVPTDSLPVFLSGPVRPPSRTGCGIVNLRSWPFPIRAQGRYPGRGISKEGIRPTNMTYQLEMLAALPVLKPPTIVLSRRWVIVLISAAVWAGTEVDGVAAVEAWVEVA